MKCPQRLHWAARKWRCGRKARTIELGHDVQLTWGKTGERDWSVCVKQTLAGNLTFPTQLGEGLSVVAAAGDSGRFSGPTKLHQEFRQPATARKAARHMNQLDDGH